MTSEKGSYNWDDPDRPKWNDRTVHEADYDYVDPATGQLAFQVQRGRDPDTGEKIFRQRRPNMLALSDRLEPNDRDDWYNNIDGVQVFPYRISEVITAPLDTTIYIVEGEKKVDALGKLGWRGFVATCAPGGAGKWRPEYDDYFKGRPVVVLPDNDERGREHAASVCSSLAQVAKNVRVLELPNLPEHGDIVDWIKAGGTADGFKALVEKIPEQLVTVRASDFAALETPKRQWLFSGLMPARNVVSLYGDGGLGKSLLAMQCSVAVASGSMWLGSAPQRIGPVVYFGCEDEIDETHRRLKDICTADQIDLAAIRDLHIIDMAGKDALLAVENAKKATLEKTALFLQLRATLSSVRPVLLVLDNLADIFGGNEIVKSLARQFIGILRGLAIEFDCVVLLLAHPSQSGRNSGEGTSGNSAWNNSVRQRLYLKPQADAASNVTDDRIRRLEVMKSNYGPMGTEIELRWDKGRFALTGPAPTPNGDGGAAARAHKAEAVFMALIAEFSAQRRKFSPHQSQTYAPTLFAKEPEGKGIGKEQFAQAMGRLLKAGRIEIIDVGKGSKTSQSLAIVPSEEVAL